MHDTKYLGTIGLFISDHNKSKIQLNHRLIKDLAGNPYSQKSGPIIETFLQILELWEVLLHALVGRRQRLELVYAYTKALQDVNDLVEYLRDLKVRLLTETTVSYVVSLSL